MRAFYFFLRKKTGWRLLHQAADEGHIKMVNKLINAGADVNIAENVQ